MSDVPVAHLDTLRDS